MHTTLLVLPQNSRNTLDLFEKVNFFNSQPVPTGKHACQDYLQSYSSQYMLNFAVKDISIVDLLMIVFFVGIHTSCAVKTFFIQKTSCPELGLS